jgi:replicative DNA helicase
MTAQRSTPEQAPLSIIHEQAALACPLVDEATFDEMAGLEPAHFQLPLHQAIWQSIGRVHGAGLPLTLPAVLRDLKALLIGDTDLYGVARGYVPQLVTLNPVPVGADYYAAQIREYARLRRCRELAAHLLAHAEEDVRALSVAADIASALDAPTASAAPRTQAQIADATLLAIEARRGGVAAGLPTGVPGLGRLHGFRPGHFVVLAARPAVGKTLLAYQMAQHMTAAGHTGLYVSLEMDAEELQERALVAESMVPATALGAADMLTEDHWAALLRAGQTLGARPLHVIDAGGVTLDTVLSWTRRYQATAGLAFLVLDYVQLLPMPNPDRVSEAAALSAITKRLKATARQLGICIIALSQLNRPGEGARPGLVNLRGSDTLGHDADLVLMLWPNEEAGTDGYSGDGVRHLVLDVRKNRQGPEPTVHMVFNPVTLTMREVTH